MKYGRFHWYLSHFHTDSHEHANQCFNPIHLNFFCLNSDIISGERWFQHVFSRSFRVIGDLYTHERRFSEITLNIHLYMIYL